MAKKIKCMAGGGVIGADGMTDEQRAKRNAALSSLGMSTAPAPVQPAQAAPLPQAPVQQPPVQAQDRPRGIIGIVGGRQQQIDKAAGYAQGGLIRDAAEYWADDNARFDNSNPSFAGRVIRAVNPLTGFGSAMGAMHTAAGNGDIPGMAMAGISAIPAFGVMRITPASGALKAAAVPSAGRAAGAVSGGAVLNAIADEYQANKPSGYANGGKIEGPGTPTSDSIPAKVKETGEEIRVSNGERIVSAEQGALLEALARKSGFESLDALLEAGTGKPVGPTIKGGKRAARYGANGEWIPDEIPKETNLSPLAGQTQAAVTPIAANQGRGVMDTPIGASFEKSIANFKAGVPQGSEITARPDVSAQQAASATGAQQTNPLVSGIQNTSPFVVAKERFPISVEGGQFITGSKPGEMPSSAQGGFTQDGKSYNVNQTSQPGISRVTAPGTSPLVTNTDPETAANQIAGMKSGQMRIGDGGFNLAEQNDRMAKSLGYASADDFNKQYAARQPGGIGIIGEVAPGKTQADLDNAEKTRRWMAEDMIAKGGPAGMQAAAHLLQQGTVERGQDAQERIAGLSADAARYGHDVNAQRAAGHDQVLMRGQDITGKNDAERNRIMEAQAKTKGIMAPIAVSGGEVANPNDPFGVAKTKLPNAVFDPNTGKWYTQPQANEKAVTTREEVQAALATGKISKDEIKKRLTSAGLNPNDYL